MGPALYVFYFLFGHQIIASMYTGDASSILNHLVQRRQALPLSFYTDLMDKNAHKFLFLPLLTMLFYFAAYKACVYFAVSKEAPVVSPSAESSRVIKYDLIIAALAYSFLTVVYFAPGLRFISTALIGPPEDNMKYFWNMWWGYKSLIDQSGSLTYSNYIFYPEGSSLLYNDYSWYNLFVSLGLSHVLNPVAAYNLTILHTFIVAGIGAFLLTKYLTQNSFAAVIAGFIYGFNPSHFAHSLHHINTSSIQFIPFFVLFFLKSIRGGSARDAVFASIFLLLNALCDWNYLIFLSYFMVFAYAYLAFKRRKVISLDVLSKITLIASGPLIILSPWLFKMVVLGLNSNDVNNPFHVGHNMYVADLIGLIVPHVYHSLGSLQVFDDINRTFTGNPWESTVYLGLVNILTVMIAYKKIIGRTAVYFGGLFVFLILSMGSFIHVLGHTVPVILPYSLLANIPFLSNARAPARNIVFVYLFLSIIMGYAVKYLYETQTLKRYGLALVIVLVMGDYYSVSSETTVVQLPSCYATIKHRTDVGGILDLPGGWRENVRYMMYQTYHKTPIVQGAIPRKIGRSLIDRLELTNLEIQKRQLVQQGIKYIVIHKRPIFEKSRIDTATYESVYKNICEDDDIIVLEVFQGVPSSRGSIGL